MKLVFTLNSLPDTLHVAQKIAGALQSGMVLTFDAELGAGKTTLIREILYSLGVVGSVKSPTYTIVESYLVRELNLYHFDLYRFNDPDEWLEAGLDEYFTMESICFIEWPSYAGRLIPWVDLAVGITVNGESRLLEITSLTLKGNICLEQLIGQNAILCEYSVLR